MRRAMEEVEIDFDVPGGGAEFPGSVVSYSLTHGSVGADHEPWQNASTSEEPLLTVADGEKGRTARTVNGGRTAITDRGSSGFRMA